ncbi:MAG: hypothetical protein IT305_22075 [Chloroflexi bacterium]|nr:hypothetical protein [Chloroflexota bacterium]
MEFVFGMNVTGSDGTEAGILDHVLVAPQSREITHIVLRSEEVSEDVLLPISLIQGNAGERLLLQVASGDLGRMPRYYEGRTSSSPAGRVDVSTVHESADARLRLEDALNVASDVRQYGCETKVVMSDGSEGWLLGLAADQYQNQVSDLRLGGLGEHIATVSGQWIGELGVDTIQVAAPRDELSRLVGEAAGFYVPRTSGEPRTVEERHRTRG